MYFKGNIGQWVSCPNRRLSAVKHVISHDKAAFRHVYLQTIFVSEIRKKSSEVLRKGLRELETGAEQMERKDRHELQIVNTVEQSKPQIQINATEEFRFGPYISSTLLVSRQSSSLPST